MSEQNLQHLGRHHTGSQMTGEANRWTRAIFDVDVGQIYGAPMRRGWCYSSYKCDELIHRVHRIRQIEIPIERHTLRIENDPGRTEPERASA